MSGVRVLFFAGIKTAAGCAETHLPCEAPGLEEEAFWERLLIVHPNLAPFRDTTRLAINSEYPAAGTLIQAGDEVALIPPVSGG